MASRRRYLLALLVLAFVFASNGAQALLAQTPFHASPHAAGVADGDGFEVKPYVPSNAYIRSSYEYRCGRLLAQDGEFPQPAAGAPALANAGRFEPARDRPMADVDTVEGRAHFRSRAPPIG